MKQMSFEIENKLVEIFYEDTEIKKLPVVVINTFENENKEILEECKKLNTKEFILVTISNIDWENEMTPWKSQNIFNKNSFYMGKADEYISILCSKIIPKIHDQVITILHKEVEYYAIAGYSLAGLFALYTGYKTNIFKRVVSASGSFWYPGFLEFVKLNEISKNIDKIYFSLGDKEKDSKNEVLKTVEEKTKEIEKSLRKNLNTIYEENKGNHFVDSNLRLAMGIKWILE